MVRWPWLCALLLQMCMYPAAAFELGEPYFESVITSEDIPDQNVTVVAQDQDGFLWVGMPSGLFRYDGYRFRRLEHPAAPSLGSAFIRALLVDGGGRLWIGTDADGLFVFDPDEGTLRQFVPRPGDATSLSHHSVMALAADRAGNLWVGTRSGLDQLPSGATSFEHRHFSDAVDNPKDRRILALQVDDDERLWIGSWNGLSRRDPHTGVIAPILVTNAAGQSLAGQLVLSLYPLEDGQMVVGTARHGAFVVSADGECLRQIEIPSVMDGVRGDPMVLAILKPVPDEIWLAGFGGIAIVSRKTFTLQRFLHRDVAVASSLAHSQVRTLIQDQAGQVWVGGYGGGLQRHDPHNRGIRMQRHSPARANALSSPNVSSVLELSNTDLWIGTRDNGIDILDRKRGVVGGIRVDADRSDGLVSGSVSSLAQTADGSVWAGTLVGLHRFDAVSHQPLVFKAPLELRDATIRRLLVARSGDLWIGSNTGLARWRPSRNEIDVLSTVGGDLLSGDINALVEAADGRLWVGCGAAGLYTLGPGEAQLQPMRLLVADRPAPLGIVGLLLGHDGTLWIDTSRGLFRLNGSHAGVGHLEDVSARLGLSGFPLGANLLEDSQGRIWTQRFLFDPRQERIYEITPADGADLGTPWFRAYTQTSDGLLLFGGSKGLLVVDPAHFQPWAAAAPLRVTDVQVDGEALPAWGVARQLNIPSGTRSFRVEYAALDFSAPRRTTYDYRLSGFDPRWITQKADRRTADYGVVPPGDYVLEVRARSRNGIEAANILRLPVHVAAAYWQTGIFRTLLVACIAALLFGAYRWRVASMRLRQRELAETVERRTRELSQAKVRAEAAYEDLRSTQQKLLTAEKMAALGGLVAGVAHEINTPLGVGVTAASHLHDGLQAFERRHQCNAMTEVGRLVQLARQCTDMILRNLDRADKLVKSFKQVAVDQSSEQRREVQLRSCLEDIVSSMQPTLKRTPHRVSIDCPAEIRLLTYPGAIYQIMANMIMNSLSHGFDPESPGQISIRASTGMSEHRALVFLTYQDDGRGMTPDVCSKVFEPFFTTKRGAGGTGLGMHITFNLVTQRLQGEIDCTSSPGAGVRFELRIPIGECL